MKPLKWRWTDALARSTLEPTRRAVGQGMARYAAEDGRNVRPGVARIVADTGLSRSTVLRARKELVEAGWLIVTRGGGAPHGGRRAASEYRLEIPARYNLEDLEAALEDVVDRVERKAARAAELEAEHELELEAGVLDLEAEPEPELEADLDAFITAGLEALNGRPPGLSPLAQIASARRALHRHN